MIRVPQNRLGSIDSITAGLAIPAVLSYWDKKKIESLIPDFPDIFDRAVVDFAKFKVGVKAGLFTTEQKNEILNWYSAFPQLWETIRPNFIKPPYSPEYGGKVDDFVGRIRAYDPSGLGLVPVVVGAALIVGGIAAGLWAVSYIQKQSNLSEMIEQVTVGKLPAAVLVEAIKAEQSGSLFGGIGSSLTTLLVVGVALWGFMQYTRKP